MQHMYVIGQTGTGKSSLLYNLIQQDIHNGTGTCLIDPHGDLAQQVLDVAPANTLYWNAADPNNPYGYNPLSYVAKQYRPLIASGLIETLKKQWADAWGARMEHLLRYALLALLERPGSTLLDVMPMFLDKTFRSEVLAQQDDEQIRAFWQDEFPAMNYKSAADGVAPIANKLGAFLAHPLVRRALCTPQKPLRMRSIIDTGDVLVVNLAKGLLGADVTNTLGGLVMTSLANAAYTRHDTDERQRRPFFLYVDEFHSFTTHAFADMFSGLRKYGIGIVASNQHASQIDRDVFDAVLGNTGTLISFRIGASDAPLIARQFGDTVPDARDLVGLANYHIYIKMMLDGEQTRPFSARTLPPDAYLSSL